MLGLQLEIADGLPIVVFDGQVVLNAQAKALHADDTSYMVSFLEPPPDSMLVVRVADTDARIRILLLFGYELTLLDQSWLAHIHIQPADDVVEVFCQPVWDRWTSLVS